MHRKVWNSMPSSLLTVVNFEKENVVVTAGGLGIQGGLSHVTLHPSGLFIYWLHPQGEPVTALLGHLNFKYEGSVKLKAWKASLVNTMETVSPSSPQMGS